MKLTTEFLKKNYPQSFSAFQQSHQYSKVGSLLKRLTDFLDLEGFYIVKRVTYSGKGWCVFLKIDSEEHDLGYHCTESVEKIDKKYISKLLNEYEKFRTFGKYY